MTIERPAAPVSRRSVIAGFGAGGLGVILDAHGFTALAQDSTSAMTVPRSGHPLIGAWRWEQEPFLLFGIFHEDGTCLEYDPDLGIGI